MRNTLCLATKMLPKHLQRIRRRQTKPEHYLLASYVGKPYYPSNSQTLEREGMGLTK
jgi:hypothetical protein